MHSTRRTFAFLLLAGFVVILLPPKAMAAPILTYDMTISFGTGSESGNSYTGSVSFDAAAGDGFLAHSPGPWTDLSITIGSESFDLGSDTLGLGLLQVSGGQPVGIDFFFGDNGSANLNISRTTALFVDGVGASDGTIEFTEQQQVIPEPTSIALWGVLATIGTTAGFMRRRRKRRPG